MLPHPSTKVSHRSPLRWLVIGGFMEVKIMKSQVDEVKQIAAQLLAGMLANPHIYHVYSTESGKLNKEQWEELIETSVAMSEALIDKAEVHLESRFKHNLS